MEEIKEEYEEIKEEHYDSLKVAIVVLLVAQKKEYL